MPPESDFKILQRDLEILTTMNGEFTFTDDGKAEYMEWYTVEEEKLQADEDPADPALSGYQGRRATHIKKLCMILSASRGTDYKITGKDFRRALRLLELTEKKMHLVFAGIGSARYARETEIIRGFIEDKKLTTKSALLGRFYRSIDDVSLSSSIKMLRDMHMIKVRLDQNETYYEWTGK
jgi:hypothetical protein